MAVETIHSGEALAKILNLFGVSESTVALAVNSNIVLMYTGSAFEVKAYGVTVGVIPVKSQAITLAQQGSLGPASKQAIAFQLDKVLMSALSKGAAKPAGVLDGVVVTGQPKVKKTTGDVMELNEATTVYQKVKGTTSGSVYQVIAIGAKLKVAIRKAGQNLSVRVIGSVLAENSTDLIAIGLAMKNGYASGHFKVKGDPVLTAKTVGCILATLGFKNFEHIGEVSEVTQDE